MHEEVFPLVFMWAISCYILTIRVCFMKSFDLFSNDFMSEGRSDNLTQEKETL